MQKDSKILNKKCLTRLENVFEALFWQDYQTKLVGGNDEPFYQAANSSVGYNTIFYTKDYFSSALHEIAHWCVAADERRKKDDYGYWYEPDGRNAAQQQLFEQVEIVPQAIERILSCAAGQQFKVSADNLDGNTGASANFIHSIHKKTLVYCARGLPSRAQILAEKLAEDNGKLNPLNSDLYSLEQLV